MNPFVIITSLKKDDAYKTLASAIDRLCVGNGVRFSEDAILIRYQGSLDGLKAAISEHLHEGDEAAIFQIEDGTGLFSDPQTESLFRQALGGE